MRHRHKSTLLGPHCAGRAVVFDCRSCASRRLMRLAGPSAAQRCGARAGKLFCARLSRVLTFLCLQPFGRGKAARTKEWLAREKVVPAELPPQATQNVHTSAEVASAWPAGAARSDGDGLSDHIVLSLDVPHRIYTGKSKSTPIPLPCMHGACIAHARRGLAKPKPIIRLDCALPVCGVAHLGREGSAGMVMLICLAQIFVLGWRRTSARLIMASAGDAIYLRRLRRRSKGSRCRLTCTASTEKDLHAYLCPA